MVGTARKRIAAGVALLVGALHFVSGPGQDGPWAGFVNGYLIDLALPFSMYLLLGLVEARPWPSPAWRAACVFGAAALVETLQYAGLPIFGRTFDPVDYLMYALGVGAAVLFEAFVVARHERRESGR